MLADELPVDATLQKWQKNILYLCVNSLQLLIAHACQVQKVCLVVGLHRGSEMQLCGGASTDGVMGCRINPHSAISYSTVRCSSVVKHPLMV